MSTKQLIICIAWALFTAGTAAASAPPPASSPVAAATARAVTLTAAPPCTLGLAVSEQLGMLVVDVKPLSNVASFAAINGPHKVVFACGLSTDETYTFKRLFADKGVELVSVKADLGAEQSIQELAAALKVPYRQSGSGRLPLSFVFSGLSGGKELKITVQPSPAPKVADAPPAAAARPVPAPAAAPAPVPAAAPALKPVPAPIRAAVGPVAAPRKKELPVNPGLADLYEFARSNDPELGRAHARHRGSQADTDSVRATLRPHLNADFGLSWIDQSTYNSGPSTLASSVFGYNYDVMASVPILHMPIRYNVAAQGAAERSEAAGVTASGQNLIVRLVEAYFGVLKSKADQRIAGEEIARVRQALEQAEAFLKAGTGDIIAVYEAQARLDSVVADLNRAESAVKIAEERLSGIVGQPIDGLADFLPTRPQVPEPDDLDWWLKTMEERDPQILQARESLDGAVLSIKSAKAEHLPVIDANGGIDVSKGAAYAPGVETRQWHVGATVTVPIYSGGETSAHIRRAAASESERRFALDQVREQRRDNLKQAFFNLRYNVSLVRALEQKQTSALVQLNGIRKGRSIGTRTAVDLLNGEAAYSVAQRDLRNALYDNVMRTVELKAAAGVVSDDDVVLR